MAIKTYNYRCQFAWCKFLSSHLESREGNSIIVHFLLMEKNDSKLLLLFFQNYHQIFIYIMLIKILHFYLNKNVKIWLYKNILNQVDYFYFLSFYKSLGSCLLPEETVSITK